VPDGLGEGKVRGRAVLEKNTNLFISILEPFVKFFHSYC